MNNAAGANRHAVTVNIAYVPDTVELIDDVNNSFRKREPERSGIEDVGIALIDQPHRAGNAAQGFHNHVTRARRFERAVRARLRSKRQPRGGNRRELLTMNCGGSAKLEDLTVSKSDRYFVWARGLQTICRS